MRAGFTHEKWSTQEGVEDGLFSFGDLVGRILSECCIMWDLKHHEKVNDGFPPSFLSINQRRVGKKKKKASFRGMRSAFRRKRAMGTHPVSE